MARIRIVQIQNFRGIRDLEWLPSSGMNCLVGPGDSGKSTILDAIDFCLGARRSVQFSDADFYRLDAGSPIQITVTVGDLDEALKSIDTYGMFLRGFNAEAGRLEEEPGAGLETVLTMRLSVSGDLEPSWSLISQRAEAQGLTRNLTWGDRVRLAPTRIGALADFHLGWRRGSVLNRISDAKVEAASALADAAREARSAFGEQLQEQLGPTLSIVAVTAKELGIPIGGDLKALLDSQSVSFSGGTVSLHDEDGVPLRGLGIGSTRLLIAGLQRKAAGQSAILLVDELEYGLEPHRIIRFLGTLGAKESPAPLQVFMTTHSPVALRELSGEQLFIVQPIEAGHTVTPVGKGDEAQGTIRLFPDAFLAPSVIICEGATEVGLLRGLDQHRVSNGHTSIAALGVFPVNSDGGAPDRPYERAAVWSRLGYRTAVIRDDDKPPSAAVEAAFVAAGGKVVAWRSGNALEDELFASLSDEGVENLMALAIEFRGEELVNEHIKSASENARDLESIRLEHLLGAISSESRKVLGLAARTKQRPWFKSVTRMERAALEVVGPDLENSDEGFKELIAGVFAWSGNDDN